LRWFTRVSVRDKALENLEKALDERYPSMVFVQLSRCSTTCKLIRDSKRYFGELGFNREVPASLLCDKLGNQEANDSAFVPLNGLLGHQWQSPRSRLLDNVKWAIKCRTRSAVIQAEAVIAPLSIGKH
jgi:hypothetical protein